MIDLTNCTIEATRLRLRLGGRRRDRALAVLRLLYGGVIFFLGFFCGLVW